MARQLGARKLWDAFAPGMGGFKVGGPPPTQSSVATPSPAAAGVSGQPAAGPSSSPAGGMGVGQPEQPFQPEEGGGTSLGTPAGNANVTGLHGGLIGQGLSFGTALAGLPGLGSVTGPLGAAIGGIPGGVVGSMLGSTGQNMATGKALSAVPSSLSTAQGAPVTFTGNQGFGLGAVAANILGSLGVPGFTAPTFSAAVPGNIGTAIHGDLPTPSPNLGAHDPGATSGTGMAGAHGTTGQGVSVAGPAAGSGMGGFGNPSQFGLANSPNAPRGNDPIDADLSETSGIPSGLPSDPATPDAPTEGVDPDTGLTPSPDPTATGEGESGDTGEAGAAAAAAGAVGGPVGAPAGDAASAAGDAAAAAAAAGPAAGAPGPGDTGDVGSDASAPGPGDTGDAGAAPGDAPGPGDTGDAGAPAGDGGGGGGAGAGSLLCNYALDSGRCGDGTTAKKARRDLDAIVERAFREKPEMKASFKNYQKVSGQIIAKMKALPAEAEEKAFAELQSELVEPVTKAARRGDATTVGRALRRATVKLAKEYGVEIPEEFLALSEKSIGPRTDDDASYNKPSGQIQKPSPKRLASMLEPAEEESPVEAPAKKSKVAGKGGMSVGLS